MFIDRRTELPNMLNKDVELIEGRPMYNYRDLNTVSTIDKTTRQKISKDVEAFNNTINKQDLIYIYRIVHQQQQNTLFSSTQRTHTKIDNILVIKHP